MIRLGAVRRSPAPSPISRDSIRPMKKVKASSTGTPAAEFLVFSIANMKPKAPPRNTIRPRPPAQAASDAGGDADPGAEHGRHHAQRQQPVGVAQDAVAFSRRRRAPCRSRRMRFAVCRSWQEPPGGKQLRAVTRSGNSSSRLPADIGPPQDRATPTWLQSRIDNMGSETMKTKSVLEPADVKRIAAAAEAEAVEEQLGGDDRHRRRRRPPAVAAAPRRRGADLGAHRAGQGAHRRPRPAREQGLRGHDQQGRVLVPERAAASRACSKAACRS